MANLTLSVPDDLLEKARRKAVMDGKSLNSLIRKFLEDYVERKEMIQKSVEKLMKLTEECAREIEKWNKEDLYER